MTIRRLRGERDDLRRTVARVRIECSDVHDEHDKVVQEHAGLLAAAGQVCDALGVPPSDGPDPPSARVRQISARVHELEGDALRSGVTQALAIGRSYYGASLELELMSRGYPVELSEAGIDQLEHDVASQSQVLADTLKGVVLPHRD